MLFRSSNGWTTTDGGSTYGKAGSYGSASFDLGTGVVTYTLNNSATATQALTAGQLVSDSFGVIQVTDGIATAQSGTISFAITGSNDGPWVSSELLDASANELGINADRSTQIAIDAVGTSGSLWSSGVYDPEGDAMSLVVASTGAMVGSYGTLTLTADGSYLYVVDNSNAAINALNEAQ